MLLLTCQPANCVEQLLTSGAPLPLLQQTQTGNALNLLGIDTGHFLAEAKICCSNGICGGACPPEVQSYVDEVSARFLRWYLFSYIKPIHVMACCGPNVMERLLDMVDGIRNVRDGVVEVIHHGHTIS